MGEYFVPFLDQAIKGVVFPYSLLYMTERIVHAAIVTNCYISSCAKILQNCISHYANI